MPIYKTSRCGGQSQRGAAAAWNQGADRHFKLSQLLGAVQLQPAQCKDVSERQASSSEQVGLDFRAEVMSEQIDRNSPLVRLLGMRRNNILKAKVVAHAPLLQALEVRLAKDAIHEPFAAHL